MINQTLYKRTTTGAVQQWSQDLDGPRYRTVSGQVDGRLVTSEWTVCEGKNSGRANATTPEEQARREVAANYTKKRKEGYHDHIEAIYATRQAVMLAKDYADYADKVFSSVFHPYSQPKLDGMRCLARADGLWSRQGNRIVSVPHIGRALEPVFADYPDLVLDGELYNHTLKSDFNRIISLCRKSKPTAQDLEESAALIEYHIYDVPSDARVFSERNQVLGMLEHQGRLLRPLHRVATEIVKSQECMDALYEVYLDDGYEGQMIRLHAPYQGKRTSDLLKRKEFQDAEFRVLDIVEGVGNRSGMAGNAVLDLTDGRTFKANCLGPREYLRDLLARRDEVIGTWGTVAYFRLTPDGVPRFPRLKTVEAPEPEPR